MKSNFLSLSRKPLGFTLIELLIVIGILATLGGISYPTYMAIQRSAQRTAVKKVCTDIVTGVERYAQDNNSMLPYDSSMAKPDAEDQIFLDTADGKDARLIEILTDREQDDDNRLNTARETYLRSDEKQDGAKRDGLYVDETNNTVNLYDAWYEPFHVILCEEQEGCVDPFSDNRKRARGKHCYVYSTGPDRMGVAESAGPAAGKKGKKTRKDKKGSKKQNKQAQQAAAAAAQEEMEEALEDNVYSWKED